VGRCSLSPLFVLLMRWRPKAPGLGALYVSPHAVEKLQLHDASAPVPSGAEEERQSKALIVETGAGKILEQARVLGISMTLQEARDHAALMASEAGL
jgi:hypothetical protein